MSKKKVKTDEVVINSRYSIWPVANGFILKPETGETSYGKEIGLTLMCLIAPQIWQTLLTTASNL